MLTSRRLALSSLLPLLLPSSPSRAVGPRTSSRVPLAPRFLPLGDGVQLSLPGEWLAPSSPSLLAYPPWLLGTWQVTNDVQAFSMPLGSAFVDSFTIASADDDVQRGERLRYLLRWISHGDGTVACIPPHR
uniref:DUF6816 domain-containing protein n=1 Tax=Calcidiscus leptoporus TaxID=127549 RepID=A0A7S0NRT9_9EUKA|mmetsp:Transcript_20913/g.48210  ORF Transcript_20913/g.48210 Transcript_20913/m.48210 type:complete len:131 (+) Transcript_20913:201-593(+)